MKKQDKLWLTLMIVFVGLLVFSQTGREAITYAGPHFTDQYALSPPELPWVADKIGGFNVNFLNYNIYTFTGTGSIDVRIMRNGENIYEKGCDKDPSEWCTSCMASSNLVGTCSGNSFIPYDGPEPLKIGINTITRQAGLSYKNDVYPYENIGEATIYTGYYFQGKNTNKIIINFTNTFNGWTKTDAPGRLLIEVQTKTGRFNNIVEYDDYSTSIMLPAYGQTLTHEVFLNPDYAIGEYIVYVQAVYDKKFGTDDVGDFPIDSLKSKRFLINPRKVYVNKNSTAACPEEYEEAVSQKTLCVRNDLKDLSCYYLGCPVTIDYAYACTSAGICAEVLFQATGCMTDADCGINMLCEPKSKVCIMKTIYEDLMQCSADSDCAKPCDGITITCDKSACPSCSKGWCKYSGQCMPVYYKCNRDYTCDPGYICNEDGACERTVVKPEQDDVIDRPEFTSLWDALWNWIKNILSFITNLGG